MQPARSATPSTPAPRLHRRRRRPSRHPAGLRATRHRRSALSLEAAACPSFPCRRVPSVCVRRRSRRVRSGSWLQASPSASSSPSPSAARPSRVAVGAARTTTTTTTTTTTPAGTYTITITGTTAPPPQLRHHHPDGQLALHPSRYSAPESRPGDCSRGSQGLAVRARPPEPDTGFSTSPPRFSTSSPAFSPPSPLRSPLSPRTLKSSPVNLMFIRSKPAIHAALTNFPQQNPIKTEVETPFPRVRGVSTSTPQHVVVLYLTRTRCGVTFNLTRSSGAAPVPLATPPTRTPDATPPAS